MDSVQVKRDADLKVEDVSVFLGVGTSTVQKYCKYLEKSGYIFKKDPKTTARLFNSKDLDLFERLVFLKEKGFSLEQATVLAVKGSGSELLEDVNGKLMESNLPEVALKQQTTALTNTIQQVNSLKLAFNQMQNELIATQRTMEVKFLEKQEELVLNQRNVALDAQLTLRRIEKQLEDTAEDEWNKLPLEKRQSGYFWWKKDKEDEKKKFIRNYVLKNIENAIEKDKEEKESNKTREK